MEKNLTNKPKGHPKVDPLRPTLIETINWMLNKREQPDMTVEELEVIELAVDRIRAQRCETCISACNEIAKDMSLQTNRKTLVFEI